MTKKVGVGQAHSKIILIGEHAVVYGYPAISLPLLEVEVSLQELPYKSPPPPKEAGKWQDNRKRLHAPLLKLSYYVPDRHQPFLSCYPFTRRKSRLIFSYKYLFSPIYFIIFSQKKRLFPSQSPLSLLDPFAIIVDVVAIHSCTNC